STFSNTFITITNYKGDKRTGASSGGFSEFRGSRRSKTNKYAASVEVKIKGIGRVRKKFLLKGSKEGGPITTRIRDVTPVPHNGC
ncbi:hypothetical protein KP509_1Z196300, partial [Ceratopteris richardii]